MRPCLLLSGLLCFPGVALALDPSCDPNVNRLICSNGQIPGLYTCITKLYDIDGEANCSWNYELVDRDKDGKCEWGPQEDQTCFFHYGIGTSACGRKNQLV